MSYSFLALVKFFQVKEVKDAKVEEEKKEEEEEKTVKREGMMVDSGKDVVDLVSFFFLSYFFS